MPNCGIFSHNHLILIFFLRIGNDFLNRFAFHHIDSDKVWVRIGLTGNADCSSELTEIGITLPLPQSLQDELAAADQGAEYQSASHLSRPITVYGELAESFGKPLEVDAGRSGVAAADFSANRIYAAGAG